MGNLMKYGIGAVVVVGAIGGGAIWYVNNQADKIVDKLLNDAQQFVAEKLNGATLNYSNYSSNGLARSVTIADVSITHDNGSSVKMDSITIAGNDEMISITDATNIDIIDRGQMLGQIGDLDIVNLAIPQDDVMLMLMDENALINELSTGLSVDTISVADLRFDVDGESLSINSLDINDVKNASVGVDLKGLAFDGYDGTFSIAEFSVDKMDIIPLLMEDEDAIARDMLGMSEMTLKGAVFDTTDISFNLALLSLDDVSRDGGLITAANINLEGLVLDIEQIAGPDIAPVMMLLNINEIDISGSTAYEISLAKGTVSGSLGLGVKGMGEIDITSTFAGLTKAAYEDILANAATLEPEDIIEDYGLGLDSLSIDYKDDNLADTLIDLYSGGNRAGMADEVTAMISFYGMMAQQAELVSAIAPAVGDFIRGGNQFSLAVKAKQSLSQDVLARAMEVGNLQDIVSITASGS